MKVLRAYLARQVLLAAGFVLLAFVALFAFFDFVNELGNLGRAGYPLERVVMRVLFGIPARIYELVPIAALIGTIYALAQLAAHSEFTIMRVSGLSTRGLAGIVLIPGLLGVGATYLFGEWVVPRAEALLHTMEARARGTTLVQAFRSGLWVKDRQAIGKDGKDGKDQFLIRYINIGELREGGALGKLKIYEFDQNLRLLRISEAESAQHAPPNGWRLTGVVETRFKARDATPGLVAGSLFGAEVVRQDEMLWASEINPSLLQVLQISPERMSIFDLAGYIGHLRDNSQNVERYQMAFWKKILYPLGVLVMMALALPFAYLQGRSGGVSLKIFAGIMLGIGFYLMNNLFSHLGLLNTWPPVVTAALPSLVGVAAALLALYRVERA